MANRLAGDTAFSSYKKTKKSLVAHLTVAVPMTFLFKILPVFSLLFNKLIVEYRVCGVHICANPKETCTEGKKTDNNPSDKGHLEEEILHFMSLHQAVALAKSLYSRHLGMVVDYVEGHREGIAENYAGYNQQKYSYRNEQVVKNACQHSAKEVASYTVKGGGNMMGSDFLSDTAKEIFRHCHRYKAGNDKISDQGKV